MKKLMCAALCVLLLFAAAGCQTGKKVDTAFPAEKVAFGMDREEFLAAIDLENAKGDTLRLPYYELGMEEAQLLGLPLVKSEETGEYYDVMCYFFNEFSAQDRAGTFQMLQAPVLCKDLDAYLTELFGEPEPAGTMCGKKWTCKDDSQTPIYELHFVDTQQDFDGQRAYHLMLEAP